MLTTDIVAGRASLRPQRWGVAGWLSWLVVASFVLVDLDVSFIERDWAWAGRELTLGRAAMLVVVAAAGGGLMFAASRRTNPLSLALGAFLGWAGFASLVGIHPVRSIVAWLVLAGAACAAAACVRIAGDRVAMVGLVVGALGLAAVSIGLDATGQLARYQGRLSGLTLEPNMIAHVCGVGLVALGYLTTRRTPERLVLAAPLLYAIYESDTRTIAGALVVAAGVAVVQRAPRLAAVGAAIAVVLVIGFDVGSQFQSAAQRSDGEDLSEFNGRLGIWELSLERIGADPFTGAGLASGPQEFAQYAEASGVQVPSTSSHSLPLEIARETGVVGLGLAAIAAAYGLARRRSKLLPLTAYLVVSALTMPMSGFAGLVTVAWFVVLTPPAQDLDAASKMSPG